MCISIGNGMETDPGFIRSIIMNRNAIGHTVTVSGKY